MSDNGNEGRSWRPGQAAVTRARASLSLIWLVPIVAALVGITLVVRHAMSSGPEVTLLFRTAEGVQPGRTEVRYKEVVVGRVTRVRLIDGGSRVAVYVRMDKDASDFASQGAKFWIMRPRIGATGVSGLGTLLSGAYIGVDRGTGNGEQSEFLGLEAPPLVMKGDEGRTVRLRAADLGSLDIGTPVYFRNMKVGRIVSYRLADDGAYVDLQVFVDAPFDQLVTTNTRFWNASGLDLTLNASGMKIDTESLATIIAGGVAFGLPPADGSAPQSSRTTPMGGQTQRQPAPETAVFELFNNASDAMAPADGPSVPVVMHFAQTTARGLSAGAPVEFIGVNIGSVSQVELTYDAARQDFSLIVQANLHPERLGRAHRELMAAASTQGDQQLLASLVARGLRAQLRNGNLLTGQMYVSLEFVQNAAAVEFDQNLQPPRLPTMPSTLAQIEPQISAVLARLGNMRFDEIGNELQGTLAEARRTLQSLRTTLGQANRTLGGADGAIRTLSGDASKAIEALHGTLQQVRDNVTADDAPTLRNLNETMEQLQRAARSLRTLSDELQSHPESLLRGAPRDRPVPGRRP